MSLANAPAAEARLLLLCAKTRHIADERDLFGEVASRSDFDWHRFLRLTNHHRVTPLVNDLIKRNGSWNIPQDVRNELERRGKAVVFRNLQLWGELVRLERTLSRAGIKAVWFKGPVLAHQAYGNLGLREFIDLDVLIPRERADDANGVLLQEGYLPLFDLITPRQQRLHEKIAIAHPFRERRHGTCVDVHWAMTERGYSFSNRAPLPTCEIEMAGHRVTTFEPAATLCYLCYHGSKHGWSNLRLISDVAEFVRRNPEIDWHFLTSSERLPIGTVRMLRLGLYLAHSGLKLNLPERVIAWMVSDKTVISLGRKILERSITSKGISSTRVYLASMQSWGDRRRFITKMLWMPSALELERIALPDRLFLLYRVLRYKRLLSKYLFQRAQEHPHLRGWGESKGSTKDREKAELAAAPSVEARFKRR